MAAPGANIRFMGIDSSLVDLGEKKSTKSNNKSEYYSLSDLNTNLATENLTQDAEVRSYDTNGQSLEFSTDTGAYGESWIVLQTTQNEFGFANTWHRYTSTELQVHAGNDEKVSYKADGMYHHNGTAPTAADADTYVQYANDIVAGNSAPHFKTENGDIIKLYQETALTTALTDLSGDITPATPDYALTATNNGWGCGSQDEFETMTSVIKNLQDRVNELETKFQAHGLIA